MGDMGAVAPDHAADVVLGVGPPGLCALYSIASRGWFVLGYSAVRICMPATGERDGLAPRRTKGHLQRRGRKCLSNHRYLTSLTSRFSTRQMKIASSCNTAQPMSGGNTRPSPYA